MLTLPLILAAVSAGLIGGFHCVGMCGGIATILSRLPPSKSQTRHASQKVIAIVPATSLKSLNTGDSHFSIDHSSSIDQRLALSPTQPQSNWVYQCKLHGGRLSTYTMIGAIFGGLGAASLQWKTDFPISLGLFVVGNLALIFLGLRLLGVRIKSFVPVFLSSRFHAAYSKLMPTIQKGSSYPYLMGIAWGALPCGLSYAIAPFALLSGAVWSGAILMLLFGLAALPHLLIVQTISQRLRQRGWMQIIRVLFAFILLTMGLMGLFYFDMKNMPDFLCVTPKY
ncbi:sulfite exporter TauE/SafE family protein [Undibacterium sp. Ji22W]|uniref:sulfite exporter TauE/SafE family protein n=1 Tax=Undibacterium sp. Ji22W TaxID=3413038 RepID=UPI003BF071FD